MLRLFVSRCVDYVSGLIQPRAPLPQGSVGGSYCGDPLSFITVKCVPRAMVFEVREKY